MGQFFTALDAIGYSDTLIEDRIGLSRSSLGRYRRGRSPTIGVLRAMLLTVGLELEATHINKDKDYEYAN